MLVPSRTGVKDAVPLQHWRTRLVFVMVVLAHSLSLAGSQLCGYSMYSER